MVRSENLAVVVVPLAREVQQDTASITPSFQVNCSPAGQTIVRQAE